MRPTRERPTYHYIGATARTARRMESLGDVGRLDEDGYLYLGDRMQDMILTGGPMSIPPRSKRLSRSIPPFGPSSIGLPDEEMGNIVHAIVEAEEPAVPEDELLQFVAERVARYKVPRSIEYTDQPMRNEAGKARRSALRADEPRRYVHRGPLDRAEPNRRSRTGRARRMTEVYRRPAEDGRSDHRSVLTVAHWSISDRGSACRTDSAKPAVLR